MNLKSLILNRNRFSDLNVDNLRNTTELAISNNFWKYMQLKRIIGVLKRRNMIVRNGTCENINGIKCLSSRFYFGRNAWRLLQEWRKYNFIGSQWERSRCHLYEEANQYGRTCISYYAAPSVMPNIASERYTVLLIAGEIISITKKVFALMAQCRNKEEQLGVIIKLTAKYIYGSALP